MPDNPLHAYNHYSRRAASIVIREYSTSFSLASCLLRGRVRHDICNLYAVVRIADEVVDGVAAGQFMPGGIQEIRPGLEDTHIQPGTGQAPCQSRHYRGLAMAGGRRADQHRRRKTGGQLAAGRTGMGNSQ